MSAFDWVEHAKCRGMPTSMFFPGSPQTARAATAVCNGMDGRPVCPVRQECADYAARAGEEYGVWGGQTPHASDSGPRIRELVCSWCRKPFEWEPRPGGRPRACSPECRTMLRRATWRRSNKARERR
jgi:WhiB family redox-sensing transcriptional regulator